MNVDIIGKITFSRDDCYYWMNVDIIGKITFSCEMTVIIDERRHYWKDNFLLRDDCYY